MKEFKDYSDGRQQWPTRVTKVLGIVQFVLGVAVICADVLAFSHTNLPIFAGVSTAFIFLASGAVAFVSAINTSHLLMVSSLFASFISSLSAIILIVHASILLFSHTSPICGLSSSCTGRTMHEVWIGIVISCYCYCCCYQMLLMFFCCCYCHSRSKLAWELPSS